MNRAFGLLLATATGCTIPELETLESNQSRNECSSSDACGGGASCQQGRCVAPEGDFDTLLVTVTPGATDMSPAADVRFVRTLDGLASASARIDMFLEAPTAVSGKYGLPATTPGMMQTDLPLEGCTFTPGADGSLPARLTFRPTGRLLGLPAKSYSVTTDPAAGPDGSHAFSIHLPPGSYDLYATVVDDGPCTQPPKLFRSVDIPLAEEHPLSLQADAPATLDVTVRWPATFQDNQASPPPSLTGWRADVIEPTTGEVISADVRLPEPVFSQAYADETEYQFRLHYAAQMNELAGGELVRLRPANDGDVAPTMVWAREGLEVLTAGAATIDLTTFPGRRVSVEGRVESTAGEGVPGRVTFSSIEVAALGDGVLSSLIVPVSTGADGKFAAELLPGKYRVVAEPDPTTDLPAAEFDDWAVATEPSFQAGKLLTLNERGAIVGRVLSVSTGDAVNGASVQAFASPSKANANAYKTQAGPPPHIPRASNTLTSASGRFAVDSDPGTFDLSIRPDTATGFPWLVRPRVVVPNVGLGDLDLPSPVVHRGVIELVGYGPVVGARIAAFVYIGGASGGYVTNAEDADSVVQIAEAVTDGGGAFELLLPTKLE